MDKKIMAGLLTAGGYLASDEKPRRPSPDSDDSDDEDPGPTGPAGPIDPATCTVSGSGFAGGAAGTPVNLFVTAKDSTGRRLTVGGEEVVVQVSPASSSTKAGNIEVQATDKGDGVYMFTYTVPARGNYFISVEINGVPIEGSPFPVYFSPADPASQSQPASTQAAVPQQLTFQQQTLPVATPANAALVMAAAANQALAGMGGLGSDATARTLYIANVSSSISYDQLLRLFSFCGKVVNLKYIGQSKELATVEFSSSSEAQAALSLNGMALGDKPIRISQPTATPAPIVGAPNPYLALQVQQIQQMQAAVLQSQQLAAHVAQLRAMARAGVPMKEEDKVKEAEAAAERLARRFGHSSVARKGEERQRSKSREPGRRSRSPTRRRRSLSRSRRRTHRSRSRSREHGSSRHHARARSRSRDRQRSRRSVSKERERGNSREKRREKHKSRSRSRSADRKERSHKEGRLLNSGKDAERDRYKEKKRNHEGEDGAQPAKEKQHEEKHRHRDKEKDRNGRRKENEVDGKSSEKHKKHRDKDKSHKSRREKERDREKEHGKSRHKHKDKEDPTIERAQLEEVKVESLENGHANENGDVDVAVKEATGEGSVAEPSPADVPMDVSAEAEACQQ